MMHNLVINTYSIGILMIIYAHSSKQNENESLQNKLYHRVLQITILMLTADILSRFDGKPDTIYPILNHLGNFVLFFSNTVIPSLWLLYVHDQVFHNEEKTKRLYTPIIAINAVNAVLVVLTQFFGWYYYIDTDNIYHRGPAYLLSVLFTAVMMLAAFILTLANRDKIKKEHYFSLVFFAIPPSVCIILQIIFYGISIVLNSVVVSLLLVSFNIQNHSIYTDYLTGINNRKKLEIYLKEKIRTSTENKTFSAIMVDLNNFKSINDTFGHDVGDNALQISAKLLGSCLRSNDFIARFGGDEFYIVLDVANGIDLKEIVSRFHSCTKKYNESSDQPYKLSFSMGYATYDCHSHMNMEEFQKQIDSLMYENKQANKEI